MLDQVTLIAEELEVVQCRASRLAHQLNVLMKMREGDQVRVRWELGNRMVTQVGVVRVLSGSSFFLELNTGSLLMIERVESLEILQTTSVDEGDSLE